MALTIVACSADEAHARLEHYTKQLRSKWYFPSLVALGFKFEAKAKAKAKANAKVGNTTPWNAVLA